MSKFQKILFRPFISENAALLILRIGTALLLFYKHGLEKITGYDKMLADFPDPIGIGKYPSLLFATITDAICAVLIMLGLFNRVASFLLLITLVVAFIGVHAAEINDHGEAMLLYMISFTVLCLRGAGKYSLDYKYFFKKD